MYVTPLQRVLLEYLTPNYLRLALTQTCYKDSLEMGLYMAYHYSIKLSKI